MLIKFSELQPAQKKTNIVPINGKPTQSADGKGAVISYRNFKDDSLSVAVTAEEVEQIEFSKDFKYMKQPSFLEWVKGTKGPYLKHTNDAAGNPADSEW